MLRSLPATHPLPKVACAVAFLVLRGLPVGAQAFAAIACCMGSHRKEVGEHAETPGFPEMRNAWPETHTCSAARRPECAGERLRVSGPQRHAWGICELQKNRKHGLPAFPKHTFWPDARPVEKVHVWAKNCTLAQGPQFLGRTRNPPHGNPHNNKTATNGGGEPPNEDMASVWGRAV